MRVDWKQLAESPARAEYLFDLLMRRVHGTQIELINGDGGDGGIDAWISSQRCAFEFKSFTSLNNSRKSQITKSLQRAQTHQPDRWILVAPIRWTPDSIRWFDKLADTVPFEIERRDRSWLDEQLVQHPDLVRYALHTAADEVVEQLRQLREEQAALPDAPALAARVQALGDRSAEISPFWRFTTSYRNGTTSVGIRPNPASPPQKIVVHLSVPDADPERRIVVDSVTMAIDYGLPAVLTPGMISHVDSESLAALNLPWEQVALMLPGQMIRNGIPSAAVLRARDGEAVVGPPLHLVIEHATVGQRGLCLHGADTTGMLRVELRIDRAEASDRSGGAGLMLRYGARDDTHAAGVDPDALLRTLRALAAREAGSGMALTLAGSTRPVMFDEATPAMADVRFGPLADLQSDIVLIRDECGVLIPQRPLWTDRARDEVARMAAMLRGQEVSLDPDLLDFRQEGGAAEARQLLEFMRSGPVVIETQLLGSVPVAGVMVPFESLHVKCAAVMVANAEEVRAALDRGDAMVHVRLRAAPAAAAMGRTSPFPQPGHNAA
jgi:hypothetical protein